MPIVTVAILTRNRAGFLAEAIRGAAAQTCADIEILVCDNASTDATPEVVAAARDPRVVYLRSAVDRGPFDNYWRGLAAARAEHVLITHDDDVMEPTLVERELAVFRSAPDTALVVANVAHIDAAGRRLQERRIPIQRDLRFARGEYLRRCIGEHLWLPTPTAMVPRALMLGLRRENRCIGPASDIGLACLLNTRGAVHLIGDPLCAYRQHGVQESRLCDSSQASIELFRYLVELCAREPELRDAEPRARVRLVLHQAEADVSRWDGAGEDAGAQRAYAAHLEAEIDRLESLTGEALAESLRLKLLVRYLAAAGGAAPPRRGAAGRRPEPQRGTGRTDVSALYRAWLTAVRSGRAGPCAALADLGLTRVVVFGTGLTAFLLAQDAAWAGVEVMRFVDSSPLKQGTRLAGVPVERPEWPAWHSDGLDAVVLTSESAQEAGLESLLRNAGLRDGIPVISWKTLVGRAAAPPRRRAGTGARWPVASRAEA